MKHQYRFLRIIAIVILGVSISRATTYFVNAATGNNSNNGTSSGTAFKTITKALSVTTNADVINVAAGTYNKSLGETFPLEMVSGVTLTGTAGALTTIVDASGDYHRVFNCLSNSATTIIQGFTITGGFANDTSSFTAISKGGGIFIEDGSPIIQNNIITRDTARGYDFYQAPGGANQGGSAYGGGIYVGSSSAPIIRNNVISFNVALGGGGKDFRGGWSGDGTQGGNTFGGAINISSGSTIIVNNTFYGNKAVGGLGGSSNSQNAGYGGNANSGAIDAGGSTIVKNNIFSNNSAIGGTVGGGSNGSNGTADNGAIRSFVSGNLSYNLYYNNTALTNADGATLGSNNIMASDPLFISTSNFHLSTTSSPAYHAGTPTGAPTTDLDGTSRSLTTPSIGAYEATDPLPVEVVSFSATTGSKAVILKWRTATEVNNFGFEIEKSRVQKSEDRSQSRATAWEKIGFVEGHGTTNAPKEYSFADNNIPSGSWSYRLKQIDRDGQFTYSSEVEMTIVNMPSEFALAQNYPNPFNPTTKIRYSLPEQGYVTLKVYNVLGKEVATIVNGIRISGDYVEEFNTTNLSSGIYFYSLKTKTFSSTKKMVLLK